MAITTWGTRQEPITSTLDAAERLASLLWAMATVEHNGTDHTVTCSDGYTGATPTAYGHVERALLILLGILAGSEENADRAREYLADGTSLTYALAQVEEDRMHEAARILTDGLWAGYEG
jgi:hypothetical protein